VSLCLIFNPAARGDKARKFRGMLESLGGDWILKPTGAPGAARRLAAEALREGHTTLVAAGGDGTLNEVLNGIADFPGGFSIARLGVLPLGTVNVFARELRLPLSIKKIWPILEAGHETRIDLGEAEFQNNGARETRLFAQLAGAGWDARTVELTDWQLKKRVGAAAYIVAGLQALAARQPRITVSAGGESYTGELVLIGNGRFYGGSFPIFHKASLSDGLLDAVVLDRVNWQKLPGHLWDWLSGKMYRDGATTYLQAAEFTLSTSARAALQLEGELAGELPATVRVKPSLLRVLIPPFPGDAGFFPNHALKKLF